MYTKDKSQRITLRLNEEQFEFIRGNADKLGVSPSDFLRMMVNVSMATMKAAEQTAKERTEGMNDEIRERAVKNLIATSTEGEGERRENETSNIDDKL